MTEPPTRTPRPRADRMEEVEDEAKTDPKMFVNAEYLQRKMAESRAQGSRESKMTGLVWGAGLIGAAVLAAFGGWFKTEAMAQEKADQAVKDAGAETDKKLAPIVTDIALIKADMANVKDDVADIKKAQDAAASSAKQRDEEILRLLRKKDR